jgi:cellulose synthase/poly-beta-1,6-N-acetylglucosamine synthase-like glycosyltransferase
VAGRHVQLPIFNEMYVVDRLIDAICELDYPQDKLEIQVLDDSTDETREIAELRAPQARAVSTSSICTAPIGRVTRPARSTPG